MALFACTGCPESFVSSSLDGYSSLMLMAVVNGRRSGRVRNADFLGPHDLVGPSILEHAVLVNPGFVREGVASDDGLVRLDGFASERRQQLA